MNTQSFLEDHQEPQRQPQNDENYLQITIRCQIKLVIDSNALLFLLIFDHHFNCQLQWRCY